MMGDEQVDHGRAGAYGGDKDAPDNMPKLSAETLAELRAAGIIKITVEGQGTMRVPEDDGDEDNNDAEDGD